MPPHLHLGKYFRYLWEEENLLVVNGGFEEVAISRRLYEERYRISPVAEEANRRLVPLMGAAALAAVSLADRESWGWTLAFDGDPFGYFVGVEPDGMICGRAKPSDTGKNVGYVQRQKGSAPMTQSFFEPASDDPAAAVVQYFEQTVQLQTRIALDSDASGVLLQPLPGGTFDALKSLDDAALLSLCRKLKAEEGLKPMGEVLIFYECRCDDEMVLNMVTSLPDPQRREVWGEERSLVIECPRCGRSYQIERPLH